MPFGFPTGKPGPITTFGDAAAILKPLFRGGPGEGKGLLLFAGVVPAIYN